MGQKADFSPACGYDGEHYHAPGKDPNCLGCYEIDHPEPETDSASFFTYREMRISLVAFAKWLLKDEPSEGREVQLVDQFIRETHE